MDGKKMKKIIAVVLITAIAIGSIFASPLTLVGSVGNAKVYDDTFNSVVEVNSVEANWIIRTSDNVVVFENEDVKLTIGENSLVKILGLDETTPVVYLLDGWLGATAKENANTLTVKTPVTIYSLTANSTVVILSNETEESGYVYQGSSTVTNCITGAIKDVGQEEYLDLSQSNVMPQIPVEGTEIAITIEQFLEGTVETVETVETTATVESVETVVEVPAEPAVVISPLKTVLTYEGYKATISAYVGKAYIEYPAFVTAQEIYDAAAAAYSAYGSYLDDIYIEVVEDGLAVVTYPETYGETEFNVAISMLKKEIPYYIASLFGLSDTEKAEADDLQIVIDPATIEIEKRDTEPLTKDVIVPLSKTFSYAGYEATITAYIGEAYIEYPTFVTAQEIYDAAATAYSVYGAYLKDVYIQVVEDGLAVVTYPEIYGEQEFNLAISLLEKELPYYIASLFTAETPIEETPVEATEAEVKTDEKEADIIEVRAPESPAQPAVEKPVEVKEKANVKFGATIGVVYGKYTEGSEFKPFIDKHLIRRIGFAPKNAVFNVDPYITIDNLTIGLHLSINVSDLKGSFKFTTNKGIAGYISSVANYIGRINYNTDSLNIDIDRNHSVEFSSPVFHSLDKAFDENNSLVATGSLKLGFLTASAFVDDLQLTNHLNGKNQFAGFNLSTGSKNVEVNASVIAIVHSLKNIDFYPAFDATAKFGVNEVDVEVYAGFASLFNVKSAKSLNVLAKTQVTLSTNLFSFGVGAAYNKGEHINNAVNNSPVTVVKAFNGQSLDVLLSAGLNWGVFSMSGSMTLPISLNGTGGHLAYNTVKTRSGKQINITTDILAVSAKLDFNTVSLSGGILFEGFSGRLVDFAKAIKNKTDRRSAAAGLLDSELATMYAQMTLKFGDFETYVRGDLATIDGYKRVSTSLGASFTF